MIWACFLHFYQPPTQKKYWVDRITSESYRRLVKGLLDNPRAKITLNVNSVLCELWDLYGHHDVIDGIKTLVQRGQLSLTGSAKYHPLLPKLPEEEIARQVLLNEESLRHYFGVVGPSSKVAGDNGPRLRGFFPPEMAYDRRLAKIVADLGYEWIIAEELSLGKPVDYGKIYTVSGVNLRATSNLQKETPLQGDSFLSRDLRKAEMMIFFRDRGFSYKILAGYLATEKLFLDELKVRFPDKSREQFLLTAMDGETFGHHRPGMERLLFDLFKISSIEMVHLFNLPEIFKERERVETRPSTWALMEHEVEKNLPFARWDDPENEVHFLQWRLTELAIKAVAKIKPEEAKTDYFKARNFLDRALHSDQYWWASAKPWWSIEYIERGAKELLETVKAVGEKKSTEEAQRLYYKILETAFEYQRSGRVDEISRQEDETIRMRTDQALPKMPKAELTKIIEVIRSEMAEVSSHQEFERAGQLRDRVKELEGYLKYSV